MKIKQEYKTNGATYQLLRTEKLNDVNGKPRHKAIYSVTFHHFFDLITTKYEVQILRFVKDKFGERLKNPTNEDFGTYGFSAINLQQATDLYDNISR